MLCLAPRSKIPTFPTVSLPKFKLPAVSAELSPIMSLASLTRLISEESPRKDFGRVDFVELMDHDNLFNRVVIKFRDRMNCGPLPRCQSNFKVPVQNSWTKNIFDTLGEIDHIKKLNELVSHLKQSAGQPSLYEICKLAHLLSLSLHSAFPEPQPRTEEEKKKRERKDYVLYYVRSISLRKAGEKKETDPSSSA